MLLRLVTKTLDAWARYVVERYNTGALADGQHGGGSSGEAAVRRRRVLDVGCGDGRVALELAHSCGCDVVGVDVNAAAVAAANAAAAAAQLHPQTGASAAHISSGDGEGDGGSAVFVVGDCRSPRSLGEALQSVTDSSNDNSAGFDVVLAQLLVSVVGQHSDRVALIQACHSQLRPGGKLMLSASAVSCDLEPVLYSALYRQGKEQTGEEHSYSLAAAFEQQRPTSDGQSASSMTACTAHQHDFIWAELANLVTKPRLESARSTQSDSQSSAGTATNADDAREAETLFELITMVKEKDVSPLLNQSQILPLILQSFFNETHSYEQVSMSMSMGMSSSADTPQPHQDSATCAASQAWFLYLVAEKK